MEYVGRFAPSPTGPLHIGSLVAAVASYCDAKAHNGQWLLRIENVDTTREVKGAANTIIQSLADYGFEWDGEIFYQDQRTSVYQHYFDLLKEQKAIYPCQCTRKEIADASSSTGIEGLIYPRTCIEKHLTNTNSLAWRMHVKEDIVTFSDRLVGKVSHDLAQDIGDFVIKRVDGLYAYQLAVVADDAEQGVTHVVRGSDLLNSTSRQIYLQQTLKLTVPSYLHIPVITNDQGEKLSKQTLAPAISSSNITHTLHQAFSYLNLNPPPSLLTASLTENWKWAIPAWQNIHPL